MRRFITVENIPQKVLITDDPMRAAMLSSHYLNDSRLIGDLRGMKAYYGTFKGIPVALISCGFGETAVELYLTEAYGAGGRDFVYLGECVSADGTRELMDIITDINSVYTNDRYFINGEVSDGFSIVDFAVNRFTETAERLGAASAFFLVAAECAATGKRIEDSVRQSRLTEAAEKALSMLVKSF